MTVAIPWASAQPEPSGDQWLDTVLVTGSQPGPGLWQVIKGDHRMWVVATLTPIPKNMEWLADDVRDTVAQSQAVLTAPGIKVDTGIGMIRAAFLVPSLLKARRNPNDARLVDVLPPDLYARWTELKQRYLPRNRRIERWRPIAAAGELRKAAAKSSGLVFRDPVAPVVFDIAKDNKIPVISASVEIDLEVDKPRQRLKAISHATLDDHDCFRLTLDAIDADIRHQRERANAWAVGDLETLRELTSIDPTPTCLRAALDSGAFEGLDVDFDALVDRARERWLAEAQRLLAEHEISVAVLSIEQVMRGDGLLATLSHRGYTVIAPDDGEQAEPETPPHDAE